MMETKTEKILKKIDTISTYSDGIFIIGAVTDNYHENKIIGTYISRHKEQFEVKKFKKLYVYKTTFQYSFSRGLGLINKRLNSNVKIAQRLLWSMFIMEAQKARNFTTSRFKFSDVNVIIDDLVSESPKHWGNIVITIPQRQHLFKDNYVVPTKLNRKDYQNVFDELLADVGEDKLQLPKELEEYRGIIEENMGSEFIWPLETSDFHGEERSYDFNTVTKEFTGKEKYETDLKQIKNWKSASALFKEDGLVYRFGVWPDN